MMTSLGGMMPAHGAPDLSAAHGRSRGYEPKRDYEREHRIAESLQRVLLRTHLPESLSGLSVETCYEAALEEATVGGDSCDAFALDGGRAALVVADASGKGLAAAERIAGVRFALRAFLREHDDPGVALSRLNDFVWGAQRLGRWDDGGFATLTLVVLEGGPGEASCLCAGGEPPLALRADGTVEAVQVCGAALGLFPAQGYAAAALHLRPGDAVLLATDGLRPGTWPGTDLAAVAPAHSSASKVWRTWPRRHRAARPPASDRPGDLRGSPHIRRRLVPRRRLSAPRDEADAISERGRVEVRAWLRMR